MHTRAHFTWTGYTAPAPSPLKTDNFAVSYQEKVLVKSDQTEGAEKGEGGKLYRGVYLGLGYSAPMTFLPHFPVLISAIIRDPGSTICPTPCFAATVSEWTYIFGRPSTVAQNC